MWPGVAATSGAFAVLCLSDPWSDRSPDDRCRGADGDDDDEEPAPRPHDAAVSGGRGGEVRLSWMPAIVHWSSRRTKTWLIRKSPFDGCALVGRLLGLGADRHGGVAVVADVDVVPGQVGGGEVT